jgi:translation initiation factor IF-1
MQNFSKNLSVLKGKVFKGKTALMNTNQETNHLPAKVRKNTWM